MKELRNLVGLIILLTFFEIRPTLSACRQPPSRPNVITRPNVRNQRTFKEYAKIEYSCANGYTHAGGHQSIICVRGTWKVSERPVTRNAEPFRCEEKQCLAPEIPNGRKEIDENKVVTYFCDIGYELKGLYQSKCELNTDGDYTLASPVPSCNPLSECEPPTDPYLQINGSCCLAGSHVTFSCDDGYELEGESLGLCLPSGNWSQPVPRCTRIKQCVDPGVPWQGIRTGDCCHIGSKLEHSCLDGYELAEGENENTITCLSDEQWSGPAPQCKPIGEMVCPKIPFEENNLMAMSDLPANRSIFLVYDEVDLGCKPGYDTQDDEMYLVCDTDGTWDSPMPMCKPKEPCSRPPTPSNGYIHKLVVNPTEEKFPILYELLLECDEGYMSESGYYGSRCEGNDVWSHHLNCTRITCSDPGFPNNGYRNGEDFHYTSNVTFGCLGSYQFYGSAIRTCQENGRWSGFTPVCDAGDTDCLDPGKPVNSYRQGNDFNIGGIVTYSCIKGTTLMGNGTRECLHGVDGAFWSGAEIECRSQHEFSDKEDATDTISGTMTVVARSSVQSSSKSHFARSSSSSNNKIAGTDVFFAFDGSGSITDEEFKQAKDFAETLIRQIGISHLDGGTRVAVTVFSKKAQEHVQLSAKSVEEVIRAIRGMKRGKKEGTDITKGLEKIMEFAQRSKIQNPNRKKIAFVITDGIWNQGGDPTAVANKLRDRHIYNVEIYAIAIGNKRNDDSLLKIAGDQKHMLSFKSHKDLVNIVAKAISRDVDYSLCGLERPVLNDTSSGGNRKRGGKFARIVGGQYVEKPWPWMAALVRTEKGKYQLKCGGSIIHKQWIMTAAHCFKTKDMEALQAIEWEVTVGATDLTAESGFDLAVSDIKLHDKYDVANLDYDIALVKLKNPVPYDLYIRPICLPPALKDMPKEVELYNEGKMATVIGYGHSKVKNVGSRDKDIVETRLKELDIKLRSEEICKETVVGGNEERTPTPQMFCAGSGNGGEDSCQGDSGGPLMQLTNSNSANNTQERWYVVGVVSWGIGCGLKDHYSYYSHVAKLREWIESVTKVEFEDAAPLAKRRVVG